MLETDSPFLVPQKAKGDGIKVNKPKYVKMIAQKIAQIKKTSETEVEKTTTKNTIKFFQL